MKIFISWSGASSRMVAEELSKWLKRVIQAVEPFYSPDIEKGAKWSNEVDAALEGTRFGIICLTPDNLGSDWVHYEAGALSKTKDASIWTFLLDLRPSDVKQPLGKFQSTIAEKDDVFRMLKSINSKLSEVEMNPLSEALLAEIFEDSWSKLETKLNEIRNSIKKVSEPIEISIIEKPRTDNDKLDEVLEILRNIQRDFSVNKKGTEEVKLIEPDNDSKTIGGATFYFETPEENQDEQKKTLEKYLIDLSIVSSVKIDCLATKLYIIIKYKHPQYKSRVRKLRIQLNGDFPDKIQGWMDILDDEWQQFLIRTLL